MFKSLFLSNKYKYWVIYLSFLIIAILSNVIMMSTGSLHGTSDMIYHVQRIRELIASFSMHNFWPQFNLNAFSQNGGAGMMMYPYVTLIPIALIFSVLGFKISTFYFVFILITFVGFLVSYYSSLSICNNRKISYVFAILYNLSGMFMNYLWGSGDLGVVIVMTILPLILSGYLSFINDHKWGQLSLALILIIGTHVLSSILVVIFLIIMTIINWKKFMNASIFISLFKAMVVVLTISSIVLLPSFYFFKGSSVKTFPSVLTSVNIIDVLMNSIKNPMSFSYSFTPTLFAVLGAFFSIIFYRKLNHQNKKLFMVGIIIVVLSTGIIPWESWSNSMISNIQFVWRLEIFPQLIFTYLFSYLLVTIKYPFRSKIILLTLVCALGLQFSNQFGVNKMMNEEYELTTPLVNDKGEMQYFSFDTPGVNPMYAYKISNNHQMNNLVYGPSFFMDYYPNDAGLKGNELMHDIANYNEKVDNNDVNHTIQFTGLGSGTFSFTNDSKKIGQLSIPFVMYNNVKYKVIMDNQDVKATKNPFNSLMILYNVKNGSHIVKITPKLGSINIISYCITFIGILLFVFLYRKKLFDFRK